MAALQAYYMVLLDWACAPQRTSWGSQSCLVDLTLQYIGETATWCSTPLPSWCQCLHWVSYLLRRWWLRCRGWGHQWTLSPWACRASWTFILPATFETHHHGPSSTWFSSATKTPSGLRLDYVLVPIEWQHHPLTSFTLPDIELGQSNIDHVAVCLTISGRPPTAERPATVRRATPIQHKIDWQAVRLCRDPQQWAKIFHDLPQPSWNLDVHTHWQLCHKNLLERLADLFPKRKSFPKKAYISEEAWAIRNQKQSLRRQAILRAHLCPKLDLLASFQAWRNGQCFRKAYLNGMLWTFRCQAAHANDKTRYRELQSTFKQLLIQQKTDYLAQIAHEADTGEPKDIYNKLRKAGFCSARRQRHRPLPMVLQADGTLAQDQDELKATWRQYFAQIECGREINSSALLHLNAYTELESAESPDAAILHQIPTLKDFEISLRRCKPHRAAGTDCIVPELCKYATKWFADYLAPLYVKCSWYNNEPIQWKGGILYEVFKNKGSHKDPENFRGILVSSHVAKAHHNAFRKLALPYHLQSADPLQFGGTPGRGVDQPSHTVRSFLRIIQKSRLSGAVFFLDIKSAYYRLLRQLAVGSIGTREELAFIMRTMKIPPTAMTWLLKAIKDPSAFERADCPPWLRKAAATFHTNTWYHVRNDDKVTATLRGTRPGDGWADLLFNVVIGSALQAIQTELHDLGLLTNYEWNSRRDWTAAPGNDASEDALSVTWADDIAVMIQHGLAAQLVESLPTILSVFVDRLAERGLILNYGAGKTEVLLLLRGPKSVACRRELYATETPSMTVTSDHLGIFPVRLVTKYRHLGHTIHANGHMTTELRLRTGQAHTAFTKFRKAVFQNLALSLHKRTSIFRACVLSVFFWGSGTWPQLRPSEMRYFSMVATFDFFVDYLVVMFLEKIYSPGQRSGLVPPYISWHWINISALLDLDTMAAWFVLVPTRYGHWLHWSETGSTKSAWTLIGSGRTSKARHSDRHPVPMMDFNTGTTWSSTILAHGRAFWRRPGPTQSCRSASEMDEIASTPSLWTACRPKDGCPASRPLRLQLSEIPNGFVCHANRTLSAKRLGRPIPFEHMDAVPPPDGWLIKTNVPTASRATTIPRDCTTTFATVRPVSRPWGADMCTRRSFLDVAPNTGTTKSSSPIALTFRHMAPSCRQSRSPTMVRQPCLAMRWISSLLWWT